MTAGTLPIVAHIQSDGTFYASQSLTYATASADVFGTKLLSSILTQKGQSSAHMGVLTLLRRNIHADNVRYQRGLSAMAVPA